MIKYLGSKRKLLPAILKAVGAHGDATSVLDLFSGTARVGHALKKEGYRVLSNDHNTYAFHLARCYVQADREEHEAAASALLMELNALPGQAGYFTQTFCHDSRFVHPDNGARVDAIRHSIAERDLSPELESIALVSLMEATDRVDSTCGVQMAYLKSWAARAYKTLELRLPDLLPVSPHGKGQAHCLDALDAAKQLSADVAYLDPPYNQHSYLANYHMWETLVRDDAPEHYGIACKRVDVRERKSAFNSKPGIAPAMRAIIDAVDANLLVVSFSDEGYLNEEELVELLSVRGEVSVNGFDYKRYVGAQIGIHNPSGERVGEVSHLRNTEKLFVVASPTLQKRAVHVDLAVGTPMNTND